MQVFWISKHQNAQKTLEHWVKLKTKVFYDSTSHCTCIAWSVFSTIITFQSYLCIYIVCQFFFITVFKRVLNFVKLTFRTVISYHQVMGDILKKVWSMENIPSWIWSFSCNRLAENLKEWVSHGQKCQTHAHIAISLVNLKMTPQSQV